MMKLFNQKAMARGFLNGVAAPAMLFADHTAPQVRAPKIERRYKPAKTPKDALKADVVKIGNDFYVTLDKHGA